MMKNKYRLREEVGLFIREARLNCSLTGEELGRMLHISQQQISRYENGINKIPLNHLVSIAVALKCPIDWFFQGCISDEDYSIQDSNMGIKNQELKYTAESVIVHNKI